jgi:hypothetical protein
VKGEEIPPRFFLVGLLFKYLDLINGSHWAKEIVKKENPF